MTSDNYHYIIDPKTNKKVMIKSKEGREIVSNYINHLKGGTTGSKEIMIPNTSQEDDTPLLPSNFSEIKNPYPNPVTDEKVSIKSKKGNKIVSDYLNNTDLNNLTGGSAAEWAMRSRRLNTSQGTDTSNLRNDFREKARLRQQRRARERGQQLRHQDYSTQTQQQPRRLSAQERGHVANSGVRPTPGPPQRATTVNPYSVSRPTGRASAPKRSMVSAPRTKRPVSGNVDDTYYLGEQVEKMKGEMNELRESQLQIIQQISENASPPRPSFCSIS